MTEQTAAAIRRVTFPDHLRPFGLRTNHMLERAGMSVEDNVLRSRDEVNAFMHRYGIDTAPLVFIDGRRIGGSDDLQRYLERL